MNHKVHCKDSDPSGGESRRLCRIHSNGKQLWDKWLAKTIGNYQWDERDKLRERRYTTKCLMEILFLPQGDIIQLFPLLNNACSEAISVK